jgi:hypothetical protein
MAEPTYTVRALDEATWAAFAALVERNNGIFGGCRGSPETVETLVMRILFWPAVSLAL